MLLHLIRHPPVAIEAGICYGRSDVALADPAMPEAAELRALLPPATLIVSSPAIRCRCFAERLAADPGEVRIDPRMQEIDFGDWERRAFDAIDRSLIDAWADAPWDFVPPRGESGQAMSLRVLRALDDWLADAGAQTSIAIVAHGGPLRVMLGKLEAWPRSQWLALRFDYASLTRLRLRLRDGVADVELRNLVWPYRS